MSAPTILNPVYNAAPLPNPRRNVLRNFRLCSASLNVCKIFESCSLSVLFSSFSGNVCMACGYLAVSVEMRAVEPHYHGYLDNNCAGHTVETFLVAVIVK